MAKRGTLDHPKTKRLGREIKLPAWAALGLLEAFWGYVSRYYPTGLIPVEDMLDVADAIRFDADLATVLLKTGWLDEMQDGYYVHDWHDHADDSVKKVLAKRGETFANGSVLRRHRDQEPDGSEREQVANDSRMDRDQEVPSLSLSLSLSSIGAEAQEKAPENDAPKTKRFIPPTLEEVQAEFQRLKILDASKNAQKFWSHYEAGEWKRGKTQIKNWKACISTWDLPRESPTTINRAPLEQVH